MAELVAKVVEGTTPKAGVAVQFTTDLTANSGGHDHDADRPKGAVTPASGVTDANGEVRFRFNATEVSGIHGVTATCNTCSNKTAAEKVTVKVPNLVEMLSDTKTPANYSLVGQITGKHTSNHWFLPKAKETLVTIVDTMVRTGWGAVGINDGSLVWGGLFDISGNWKPSHSGHRTGNEVDLSFNNPRLISNVQKRTTYTELCKKDNAAFSVQTLWHQDDGYPPHFHLYLDGVGLTSEAKGGPCCERYNTKRAKQKKDGSPVLDASGNPVQETVALCEETSPR